MRFKKSMMTLIILVSIVSLSTLATYGLQQDRIKGLIEAIKNSQNVKEKNKAIEELNKETDVKLNSLTSEQKEKRKIVLEKVKKMMDKYYEEIKIVNGIDDSKYIKLEFSDLNSLFSGEYADISDSQYLSSLQPVLERIMSDLPLGSTEPFLLFKKDKSEVLVAFKDKDGNNIIKKALFNGKSWSESEIKTKGSQQLKINDF